MPFLPDLIVRSRRLVSPGGTQPASVHIRGGKIVGVLPFDDVPEGCPIDDAGNAAVMPGVVDTHVHVSEPGGARWEGFETATRAAAAGGITTLVDMPMNSGPPTTTADAVGAKRHVASGASYVDVGLWAGVVPGNEHELMPMLQAGALGFTCALMSSDPNFPAVSVADLRVAMPAIARLGVPLLVHAELPGPKSHPKEAENEGVAEMIALCREFGTRTHILHFSSSDALTPLFHARSARLPITAETCPHYLWFVADEIADATRFTCAPPIRERENREFLWAALAGGLIQMVASDHSPAPPGIASLQLSLSIMWTGSRARGYTLSQLAEWMCRSPARLAGLTRKGAIEVGFDADLVVFEPDVTWTVEPGFLERGHGVTPYLGLQLAGVVERTYVRGMRVYERGRPFDAPRGRMIRPT